MNPIPAPRKPMKLNPLSANPLVSILIPSYNQGQFIGDTIDSILQQDYRPIKIHVVDGASTDGTLDVLKSYGKIPELEWVSAPDKGVVDAVNKGFELLEGDICGIQSSDDMYLPGTIRSVVELFQQHEAAGLVYGDTVKVDSDGNEILRHHTGDFSLENLFKLKTWIPQPSAFFRREMLETCGGWNEAIPYAPDTDLWIRMAFRAQVIKSADFLSQRRMHDEQRDTQGEKIIRDYCLMIDQSPDIAASSPQIQRAARASKYLMKIRYNPTGSDWRNAWNRFRAGQISPELRDISGLLHDLLLPARRVLSAVKQTIAKPAANRHNKSSAPCSKP
ncbi:glycosyltransferase involved in cell wall biosynthesis [Rhodopirellula rubra]|uniref:Glycosyltransferase involved in cell wall biosynthesis n=1 Tax=Aporhodopirellula rubra TaxID=980271 RepID=A0A7W5H5X2_9BACT|nr:glycosyltransferase family 2 protein [Aporhodopirellula rubra]MBB3206286.1 glycosyltransferase involved in cell wall biosynthesis [Aporhodopirellula rubra]